MSFRVRMGVPEMDAYYQDLLNKARNDTLSGDEKKLFKRLRKALRFLEANPRHPGLKSHEIPPLTRRYGMKVFESYLDQSNLANRIFWVYGPDQGDISVIGLEPHPEDSKSAGYDKVTLSGLPPSTEQG